jgi:hypothetical protein
MPISIECPVCRNKASVPDHYGGKTVLLRSAAGADKR